MVFKKELRFGRSNKKAKIFEVAVYGATFCFLFGCSGDGEEGVWYGWRVKIYNFLFLSRSRWYVILIWGLRDFLRVWWWFS